MDPSHLLLLGNYCTVQGLQSEAAKRYNGCECFVAKVDPANKERFAVLFTFDKASGDAKYVSLKPQNLVPKFAVAVKDSTLSSSSDIAGKGLFATKDFARGEIILSEMPLFSIDISKDGLNIKRIVDKALSKDEQEMLSGLTTEGVPAHIRSAAESLGDVAGKWWLIANANGMSDNSGTSSTYALLSRINHCCFLGNNNFSKKEGDSVLKGTFNVWWHAPSHTKARVLTAARDIKAGEELFADYVETKLDSDDRIFGLIKYGIKDCRCSLCRPSSAIAAAIKNFSDSLAAVKANSVHKLALLASKPYATAAAEVKMTMGELRSAAGSLLSTLAENPSTAALVRSVPLSYCFDSASLSAGDNSAAALSSFPIGESSYTAFTLNNRAAIAGVEAHGLVLSLAIQQGAKMEEIAQYFDEFKTAVAERRRVKLDVCGGDENHPYAVLAKTVDDNDIGNFSKAIVSLQQRAGRA